MPSIGTSMYHNAFVVVEMITAPAQLKWFANQFRLWYRASSNNLIAVQQLEPTIDYATLLEPANLDESLRLTSLMLCVLSERVSEGLEPVYSVRAFWMQESKRSVSLSSLLFRRFLPARHLCTGNEHKIDKLVAHYVRILGKIETLLYQLDLVSKDSSTMEQKQAFIVQATNFCFDVLSNNNDSVAASFLSSIEDTATPANAATMHERAKAVVALLQEPYTQPREKLALQPQLLPPQRSSLFFYAASATVVGGGLYVLWANKKTISKSVDSYAAWFKLHLYDPLRTIMNELFFNQKLQLVANQDLADARASLQTLMTNYYEHKGAKQTIDRTALDRSVQNLDLAPLDRDFEEQLKRPLWNLLFGDVIELGIIQMEFAKHEGFASMGVIDQIMVENHFNSQLMAMAPAVLVLYTSLNVFRGVWYYLIDDSQSLQAIQRKARLLVDDIERLVALNQRAVGVEESLSSDKARLDSLVVQGQVSFLVTKLLDIINMAGRFGVFKWEGLGAVIEVDHVNLVRSVEELYPRSALGTRERLMTITRMRSTHSILALML